MTSTLEQLSDYDPDRQSDADFELTSDWARVVHSLNQQAAIGYIAAIEVDGDEALMPPSAKVHNNLWLHAVETYQGDGTYNAFESPHRVASAYILAICRGDVIPGDDAEMVRRAEQMVDELDDSAEFAPVDAEELTFKVGDMAMIESIIETDIDDIFVGQTDAPRPELKPSQLFQDWAVVAIQYGDSFHGASSDRVNSILSGGPQKLALELTMHAMNERILTEVRALGASEEVINALIERTDKAPETEAEEAARILAEFQSRFYENASAGV